MLNSYLQTVHWLLPKIPRIIFLLILACDRQLVETRRMGTQIAAEEAGFGTPLYIRQCIYIVTHQLSTFEWSAYAILDKVAKSNFGSEISSDRIRSEPGKSNDLHIGF